MPEICLCVNMSQCLLIENHLYPEVGVGDAAQTYDLRNIELVRVTLRTKKKRLRYCCPSHTFITAHTSYPRAVLCYFPCSFLVHFRSFTELLATCAGNSCGSVETRWEHVCARCRWHHTFHDVETVKDSLFLTHKDPWGKMNEGKSLIFSLLSCCFCSISHIHTLCICLFQWLTKVLPQVSWNSSGCTHLPPVLFSFSSRWEHSKLEYQGFTLSTSFKVIICYNRMYKI